MESDLGDLKDESELYLIGQVEQRCRRVPSAVHLLRLRE